MEKPSHFPEEIWVSLTPEQKRAMIETAEKMCEETAEKIRREEAAKKSHQHTQASELFRIGGREARAAKKLLEAAIENTSSIYKTLDKLEELKRTVNQRAETAQSASEACQRQVRECMCMCVSGYVSACACVSR